MVRRTTGIIALYLVGALPLAAQGPRGAFVVRLGGDTTFIEQYARDGNRLEGEQISRVAERTTLRHFIATFDAAGHVSSYELSGKPAADSSAAAQRVTARFGNDSAIIEWTVHDSSRTLRVPVPTGTLPYVGSSYALVELMTEHAPSAARDAQPAVFTVLPLGSQSPFVVTVQRATADTLLVTFGAGAPLKVRIDSSGHVLEAWGTGASDEVTVTRVTGVDFGELAQRFSSRPLNLLAPRDSIVMRIGNAAVSVAYARPSLQGHAAFGDLVPWGQVWRTGANAATRFQTSGDLVMGGKTIPAGSYTLWTIPGARGWKLIVNKQVGQWGTQYDSAQDLVRLDMKVAMLAEPVEQMTISLEPQGTHGVLRVAWEATEASIPFRTK